MFWSILLAVFVYQSLLALFAVMTFFEKLSILDKGILKRIKSTVLQVFYH